MADKFENDAKLFKALADYNRLAILQLLTGGEKCACVLLEKLKIQQPTLSHHMKILCDSGIVVGRKEGKWMHYSICPNTSKQAASILDGYLHITENGEKCDSCKN